MNYSYLFALFALICVAQAAPNVKATLYYESYCPGCEQFITQDLVEFRKLDDMMAITDIELVPYGNAHVITRDPPTFQCQHGDKECYGNWVELCAQKHFPENWWNFILCEETSIDFTDEGITKCAAQAGINAEEILKCAHGPEGPLLHLEAADKTPADHKWVPWIVVDDYVLGEEDEFLDVVCKAYKGEKPASCKKSTEAPKVKATLYYEVYCPDCEDFITQDLVEFRKLDDMMAITDIEFVAYGNAKVLTRDPPTFKCQHGDKECYGNWVELCAQKYNPENWWNFILCEETSVDFTDEGITKCATQAGINADEILKCAHGPEGPLLHLEAADKTPEHKWVPWVIVDDYVMSEEDNFLEVVCKAYKGEKPASCKKFTEVEKVKVVLYHETYCGACKNLLRYVLDDFYNNKDIAMMVDWDIVPYGNAKILTRDPPTFECQHGEEECYGNMVQDCAIHYNKDKYWNFIVEIEIATNYTDKIVMAYATQNDLDGNQILECAHGPEGPLLHLEAGDRTPEHKYVPWLTIDGVHIDHTSIETDFVKEVCKAYKGEKPAICNPKN